MNPAPFTSYAQNGEDVVLFRALGKIENGRYIDVGANDPIEYSITYAFYQRGWSGITIDPVPEFARKQRAERPRDVMAEVAISDDPSGSVTLHLIADTGLSTLVDDVSANHQNAGWGVEDVTVPARRLDAVLADAGWQGLDIHFMIVDTEGAERTVLQTIDLRSWRPWVLVVEATMPLTSEPTHESWEWILLDADYRFCLFDGLSRFYVAAEKWEDLHELLSIPANVLDNYSSSLTVRREEEIFRLTKAATDLTADRDRLADEGARIRAEHEQSLADARRRDEQNSAAILQWRTAALRTWATAASASTDRADQEITLYREKANQQIALHINHVKKVDDEVSRLRTEINGIRHTLSWRITAPLRRVRSVRRRSRP